MNFSKEEHYIFAMERFFNQINDDLLDVTMMKIETHPKKYKLIPEENIYPIFIQIRQESFGYILHSVFTWVGRYHSEFAPVKMKNGESFNTKQMVHYIEKALPEAFTKEFYDYKFDFSFEEIKKLSEAIKLDKELNFNDNINNKILKV